MAELMNMTPADPFTATTMRELAEHRGTCITIFLPTSRAGAETTAGAKRLKALLEEAERELIDRDVEKNVRKELLAPAHALVEDSRFWQQQADGLAIFLADGYDKAVRFSHELPLEVHVGDQFVLRPVLPISVEGNSVLLFAFGQQSVRLFEADRDTMRARDLGDIPADITEVPGTEGKEGQLQHQHTTMTAYHGHGSGKEIDLVMTEKYIRRLAEGVDKQLANGEKRPLVLATVNENAALFRKFSKYKNIYPEIIPGNPRRESAEQLHKALGNVVGDLNAANREATANEFKELLGTGKASTDLNEIKEAVETGRVATLLVDSEQSLSAAGAALDPIIADALKSSAEIVPVTGLEKGQLAGAIFRY